MTRQALKHYRQGQLVETMDICFALLTDMDINMYRRASTNILLALAIDDAPSALTFAKEGSRIMEQILLLVDSELIRPMQDIHNMALKTVSELEERVTTASG